MSICLPSFRTNLLLALLLRLALIAYSEYYDARPEANVKYTDVDYRVFSDAARFLLRPDEGRGNQAEGIVGKWLGLGDPYTRATYRYTPLLAVLMTPNILLHSSLGKVLFAVCDLVIAGILYSLSASSSSSQGQSQKDANTLITLLILFNPLIFSISTRGSSESILGAMVLTLLYYAKKGKWDAAAVWFGVAVHWKIYPFIYGASLLVLLGNGKDWAAMQRLRFAVISGGTFLLLGGAMYAIWGYPFLTHTYLYHLARTDHRHNFSPYFYPIYLNLYNPRPISILAPSMVANPLLAFLPQLGLAIGSGFLLPHGKRGDGVEMVWFVQTVCFVAFNKVCTSQYFLWYIWFLPLIVPRIKMPRWEVVSCLVAWVGSQALWLSLAYQLEFNGLNVFLELFFASLGVLLAHVGVLWRMMKWYEWEWVRAVKDGKEGKVE